MTTIWHDYPRDNEPTTCCGRTVSELPLGDGRTSDVNRVTCKGDYEPAVFAHEVYGYPSELSDEPPSLEHAALFHLARAVALFPPEFDSSAEWMERVMLALAERSIACHVVALHKGLSGQEALDWAHAWSSGDDGELIYDLARQYGVDLDRIKPYALSKKAVAS